jgi:hypothetical protein
MLDPGSRNRPDGFETVPAWLLIVNIVGVCVFVALGLHYYFTDHSAFGLLIAVWAGVIAPITWWQKLRRTKSLHDRTSRTDEVTGKTFSPPGRPKQRSASQQGRRWRGAADLPTSLGRVTTTAQVAILEIVDGTLTLRLRPYSLMRRVLRVETLRLRPADTEAVFPARARLRLPAIGIRPMHGPPSYFVTASWWLPWYFGRISRDRSAILAAIESAGFPVTWEERRFSRS